MTTTEQTIRNIFMEVLGLDESEVTNDATSNDLGMDSLDKVDVVQSIEYAFHIDINDSEFDGLKQFSDYVLLVESKTK